MKSIWKLSTLLVLFALVVPAMASNNNTITPLKENVTEVMNNYDLNGQNNSLQLACEIGQYVSEEYGWNCDIRQLNFTKHAPVYINVFYPAADNKKGYEAYYGWFGPQRKEVTGFWGKDKKMYYRDWYEPGNECYISGLQGYGIVQSYFGDIQNTDPVEIVEPDESTQPINDFHDEERIVVLNSSNSTVQNIEDNVINNTVMNSTNTVNNQGIIDTVKQYWFDLKNANLNNVTFNFFGGN